MQFMMYPKTVFASYVKSFDENKRKHHTTFVGNLISCNYTKDKLENTHICYDVISCLIWLHDQIGETYFHAISVCDIGLPSIYFVSIVTVAPCGAGNDHSFRNA